MDDAIQQIGNAKPAADYQARLRERVSVQAEPAYSRWRIALAVATTAAVLAVIGRASPQWWQPGDTRAVAPGAIMHRAPTDATVKSTVAVRSGQPAPTRAVRSQTRLAPGTDKVGKKLEVLVPAGQPQVIARLLASLQGQEPAVASQLVGRAGTLRDVDPFEDVPFFVTPIRIDAVDVPELLAPEPLRTN